MTWKKGRFPIALRNGMSMEAEGYVSGPFGIRRFGKGRGFGYNLTHVPTGAKVSPEGGFRTLEQAKAFAAAVLPLANWAATGGFTDETFEAIRRVAEEIKRRAA